VLIPNAKESRKVSIYARGLKLHGNPTFTLYKPVQLSASKWRYPKAAFHSNGKIKPHYVIVGGEEEKHEGDYFLAHDGKWIPVGDDPLEAQRKRAEYLTRANSKRLHPESTVLPFAARQREGKSIRLRGLRRESAPICL